MWGRLKIKAHPWLQWLFHGKEYDIDTKEIISRQFEPEKELTGSEKMLADELKWQELISQISMANLNAGCGICPYCGKWQHNLRNHEARCPQRPETARPARG